jgi:antitoxin (DNA-binding transcriptional repressor) of toxin-antitoxin stability system
MEMYMQTVRAVDANRQISSILKQASLGEEFLVISRGKPVATIGPANKVDTSQIAARSILLERLGTQDPTGGRNWSRDELYERTP